MEKIEIIKSISKALREQRIWNCWDRNFTTDAPKIIQHIWQIQAIKSDGVYWGGQIWRNDALGNQKQSQTNKQKLS